MLQRNRSGFIAPCLPSPAERPPSGQGWLHEIKLDGFRLMARRDAAGVRLLTRNGIDWSTRYPSIAISRQQSRLPIMLTRRPDVIPARYARPVGRASRGSFGVLSDRRATVSVLG
jgi:hypothetical protein